MARNIANMKFAKIYSYYVDKVVKKGRTTAELTTVICWLSGHNEQSLEQVIKQEYTVEDFFMGFPVLNPNAYLIKGTICGVKIESITDEFMKRVRYLDKLVDELAKGKSVDKICREFTAN